MAKQKTRQKKAKITHVSLPDPKNAGPYRPFSGDPGWEEAWWWLWLPVLGALIVLFAGLFAPRVSLVMPRPPSAVALAMRQIKIARRTSAAGALMPPSSMGRRETSEPAGGGSREPPAEVCGYVHHVNC